MRHKLSKRLQAAADFIPGGARVADVGADHAKLSVWLAAEKGAACIATDLNPAPLERARLRFADQPGVQFRLGYGLTCVEPREIDAVVIAGMGGETIIEILSRSPWSREKLCVLQPSSRAYLLRRFCYQNGYAIHGERVLYEAGRWYAVMAASQGAAQDGVPADFCFISQPLRIAAESETDAVQSRDILAYAREQINFLRDVTPKMANDSRQERRETAGFFARALDGLERWRDGL